MRELHSSRSTGHGLLKMILHEIYGFVETRMLGTVLPGELANTRGTLIPHRGQRFSHTKKSRNI
jgi:hypothetical protein